jgi:hypothetical protein
MVRVLVQVDTHSSAAEQQDIHRCLVELGTGEVQIFEQDPGIGGAIESVFWTVIIVAPLSTYLTTLAQKAAEDSYPVLKQGAYVALKRAIESIRDLRTKNRGPNGHYLLRDSITDLPVILDADLPDTAYEALSRLDLSGMRGRYVKYNRDLSEWQIL